MRSLLLLLVLAACSENNLVSKHEEPAADDPVVAPEILVEPPAIDFGEVIPGDSATATVRISNLGNDVLTIRSLASGSNDVSYTNVHPALSPGENVETVLTWTPSASLDSLLTVTSNDGDEPQVEVPLSGTIPAGDLVVDPITYDFGSIKVGDTATVSLTVSNVGFGPIEISDWIYGANDADLRVIDAGAFATLPATLDAGASTHLTVEYAPSAEGGDEGGLTLSSNDPDEPVIVATQTGSGNDPCHGYTQTVTLMLTADDAWEGWMDSSPFTGPNANSWSASDTFEWEMECGDHTLALYATDTAHAVSGVIAVVWVEGVVKYVSGPTDWTMVDTAPPAGWTDVGFDDSSWNIPQICSNTSMWGSAPQPFYDLGAQWIWWTSTCTDLGQAWLRLNFNVTAP